MADNISVLLIGVEYLLIATQTYALPTRACYGYVVGTTPSESNDNSTYTAVVPDANLIVNFSGKFIKTAGADTTITLKAC